jgi:hypothetical protein
VIADRLGAYATSVARIIALVLAGLGIAVTQIVALLGGQAASLIGTSEAHSKATPKLKPQGPTSGGTK